MPGEGEFAHDVDFDHAGFAHDGGWYDGAAHDGELDHPDFAHDWGWHDGSAHDGKIVRSAVEDDASAFRHESRCSGAVERIGSCSSIQR